MRYRRFILQFGCQGTTKCVELRFALVIASLYIKAGYFSSCRRLPMASYHVSLPFPQCPAKSAAFLFDNFGKPCDIANMSRLEVVILTVLLLLSALPICAQSGDTLVVSATVPTQNPNFTLYSTSQPYSCDTVFFQGDAFMRLDQSSVARCLCTYVIDVCISSFSGAVSVCDIEVVDGVRFIPTGLGIRFYVDYSGYVASQALASWTLHAKSESTRGSVTLSISSI